MSVSIVVGGVRITVPVVDLPTEFPVILSNTPQQIDFAWQGQPQATDSWYDVPSGWPGDTYDLNQHPFDDEPSGGGTHRISPGEMLYTAVQASTSDGSYRLEWLDLTYRYASGEAIFTFRVPSPSPTNQIWGYCFVGRFLAEVSFPGTVYCDTATNLGQLATFTYNITDVDHLAGSLDTLAPLAVKYFGPNPTPPDPGRVTAFANPPLGSRDLAITALAIAGAESSYLNKAHDAVGSFAPDLQGIVSTYSVNGRTGFGPWACNLYYNWTTLSHRAGSTVVHEVAKWLADLENNAISARLIYDRQGWGAWSVYNQGQYTAHKAEATAAVDRVLSGVTVTPTPPPGPAPITLADVIALIQAEAGDRQAAIQVEADTRGQVDANLDARITSVGSAEDAARQQLSDDLTVLINAKSDQSLELTNADVGKEADERRQVDASLDTRITAVGTAQDNARERLVAQLRAELQAGDITARDTGAALAEAYTDAKIAPVQTQVQADGAAIVIIQRQLAQIVTAPPPPIPALCDLLTPAAEKCVEDWLLALW